jgi:hypothetical protein
MKALDMKVKKNLKVEQWLFITQYNIFLST